MIYLELLARKIYQRAGGTEPLTDSNLTLYLGYAVLAYAKGAQVTPHDVHNAWVAWAFVEMRGHPSLVPFQELPVATQRKDERFVEAIRDVASDMGGGGSEP